MTAAALAPANEAAFGRKLLQAFSRLPHVRVWRQNVGTITFRDANGKPRVFRAGPPKGASDISGILTDRSGARIECETKMPGRKRTPEQENWARFVVRAGGIYVLYTYDDDLDLAANAAAATDALRAAIAARIAARADATALPSPRGQGAARAQRAAMQADLAAALGLPATCEWRALLGQVTLLRTAQGLLDLWLAGAVSGAGVLP